MGLTFVEHPNGGGVTVGYDVKRGGEPLTKEICARAGKLLALPSPVTLLGTGTAQWEGAWKEGVPDYDGAKEVAERVELCIQSARNEYYRFIEMRDMRRALIERVLREEEPNV